MKPAIITHKRHVISRVLSLTKTKKRKHRQSRTIDELPSNYWIVIILHTVESSIGGNGESSEAEGKSWNVRNLRKLHSHLFHSSQVFCGNIPRPFNQTVSSVCNSDGWKVRMSFSAKAEQDLRAHVNWIQIRPKYSFSRCWLIIAFNLIIIHYWRISHVERRTRFNDSSRFVKSHALQSLSDKVCVEQIFKRKTWNWLWIVNALTFRYLSWKVSIRWEIRWKYDSIKIQNSNIAFVVTCAESSSSSSLVRYSHTSFTTLVIYFLTQHTGFLNFVT